MQVKTALLCALATSGLGSPDPSLPSKTRKRGWTFLSGANPGLALYLSYVPTQTVFTIIISAIRSAGHP